MKRDTNGRFESVRNEINDERVSALFPEFKEISMTRVVIELFLSFMYGYAIGICVNSLTIMFVMLGFPVFVNFIVWLALLSVGITFAIQTASPVVSTVYEAGVISAQFVGAQSKRAWDSVSTNVVSLKQKYAA